MYTYIPESFNILDLEKIIKLVNRNSFATLVTVADDGEIYISHLPVIVEDYGENWLFSFHMANKNEHHQALGISVRNVLIFKGPHAYISPSWYEKKLGVPTWNYAVAHFEGSVTVLSEDGLSKHLEKQVLLHDPDLLGSGIMPDDFVIRLSGMITGFKFKANKISCKFKLGQNRSEADFNLIRRHLIDSKSMSAIKLAELMK